MHHHRHRHRVRIIGNSMNFPAPKYAITHFKLNRCAEPSGNLLFDYFFPVAEQYSIKCQNASAYFGSEWRSFFIRFYFSHLINFNSGSHSNMIASLKATPFNFFFSFTLPRFPHILRAVQQVIRVTNWLRTRYSNSKSLNDVKFKSELSKTCR